MAERQQAEGLRQRNGELEGGVAELRGDSVIGCLGWRKGLSIFGRLILLAWCKSYCNCKPPHSSGLVPKAPLRHSSLMGMPASACLMKPMICSSVNLLFFMSVILLVTDFSNFTLVWLVADGSNFSHLMAKR